MGKKWQCMYENCCENAINSHLLMRNGILNYVAENGRLVELRTSSPFAFKKDILPFSFKEVGIKQAISLPLFCNLHDTELFQEIEEGSFDFQNNRHLVLYSYRALCAEIRRKQIGIEQLQRELKSSELSLLMTEQMLLNNRIRQDGLFQGVRDLEYYKQQLLSDLKTRSESFAFKSISLPIKGLYASTISTLFSNEEETFIKQPLNIFIFHLIPQKDFTQLVLGYHKNHFNRKMIDYINSWENLNIDKTGYRLTGILSLLETWGMSPSLYKKIPTSRVELFYKFIESNMFTIEQEPNERMNLFKGMLLNK